jgi:hypothetical protein
MKWSDPLIPLIVFRSGLQPEQVCYQKRLPEYIRHFLRTGNQNVIC